jgi:CheY-like chemotaxis protein
VPEDTSGLTTALRGLKILVTDDCEDLRMLFGYILEAASAEVIHCENGFEALEACKKINPDVILIDMKMPKLDGYETVPIIRQRGFQKPIIAITAHALRSEKNKCLALGCSDYLSKPVNAKLLIQTIAMNVKQHQYFAPNKLHLPKEKVYHRFGLQ